MSSILIAFFALLPNPSFTAIQDNSDLEKQIYVRIQRDGGLADPALPYILYVRKVDGHKLRGVQFMRYDAARKKFEMVVRADTVEICVDSLHKRIYMHTENLEMKSGGDVARVETKIWTIDLPGAGFLKKEGAKLPNIDDLPLTQEERKFLTDGFPKADEPAPVDQKLAQAFGPNCSELQSSLRIYVPSFNLVLAADDVQVMADGGIRYAKCSITRFRISDDGKEVVQLTIRSTDLISDFNYNAPPLKSLTFESKNGVRTTFKAR